MGRCCFHNDVLCVLEETSQELTPKARFDGHEEVVDGESRHLSMEITHSPGDLMSGFVLGLKLFPEPILAPVQKLVHLLPVCRSDSARSKDAQGSTKADNNGSTAETKFGV